MDKKNLSKSKVTIAEIMLKKELNRISMCFGSKFLNKNEKFSKKIEEYQK